MQHYHYHQLSKEISYALRHAPHEYELELDEQGWVLVGQLFAALRDKPVWRNLQEQHLHEMLEASDKKRFEIIDGRIRAIYGHSTPQKISREPMEPPHYLYHGTARRFLDQIKRDGLRPQSRQYVHLSADTETAVTVGKRRDAKPVLLRIHAKQAWDEGVLFYYGHEKVWLADLVDSKYIEEV
ncbi:RNA 2'-phosphotransferase [Brevibacillus dissolubilis]|uniref:RNA 2'-phosphotransferase n=1 Tax=Brevibacillus dissolubilis TaxID=1844116 RepID=UPI001116ADEC|nr:RNA 2'-phosphotransferase [Brevibacillus dissolubilis]